jgi:hypothetical protein
MDDIKSIISASTAASITAANLKSSELELAKRMTGIG